jgi:hypothetical protein
MDYRKITRLLSISFLLCLSAVFTLNAQTFNKTIEKTTDRKAVVEFTTSKSELNIKAAKDNKIHWVTQISVAAKSEDVAQELFDNIEMDIDESSDKLRVDLNLCCIKNWNQNNKSTTITFKNGRKLKGLNNFKMTTTLYLPATEKLSVGNKFQHIDIASDVVLNDLEAELYHSDLKAVDINGELELKAQFSEVVLSKVSSGAEITLYHAKLAMEDAQEIDLKSQFSTIEMGNVMSLTSTSYHDKVHTKAINGDMELDQQFSNWKCATMRNADIVSYHGEIKIDEIRSDFQKIEVDSKFTNISFSLPDSAPYHINAELSFGNLTPPKGAVVVKQIEKHHQKEYEYKSANATATSPVINIESYHGSVKLD